MKACNCDYPNYDRCTSCPLALEKEDYYYDCKKLVKKSIKIEGNRNNESNNEKY